MDCSRWNETWVTQIYGEIEPDEKVAADAHLAGCATCRATYATLESAHSALRDHPPVVPQSPGRTLLIAPRRRAPLAVGFAAGWAAAAAVFVLGWLAGARPWNSVVPAEPSAAVLGAPAPSAVAATAVQTEIDALNRRLVQLEARAQQPGGSSETWLTSAQLRGEMDRLTRNFERARQRDMDYVMSVLAESQLTTTSWLNQTQGAIEYLALRQDPRLSER